MLNCDSTIVKHDKVSSLKAKNSPCSQDEWETILQSILLEKAVEDSQRSLLDGVEVAASIEPLKSIEVTIRKRTEGITVSIYELFFRLLLTNA